MQKKQLPWHPGESNVVIQKWNQCGRWSAQCGTKRLVGRLLFLAAGEVFDAADPLGKGCLVNQETGDLFTDGKNHFAAGTNESVFPLFDGDFGIARTTEDVLDFCVHVDCSRDPLALSQPPGTRGGSVIVAKGNRSSLLMGIGLFEADPCDQSKSAVREGADF